MTLGAAADDGCCALRFSCAEYNSFKCLLDFVSIVQLNHFY